MAQRNDKYDIWGPFIDHLKDKSFFESSVWLCCGISVTPEVTSHGSVMANQTFSCHLNKTRNVQCPHLCPVTAGTAALDLRHPKTWRIYFFLKGALIKFLSVTSSALREQSELLQSEQVSHCCAGVALSWSWRWADVSAAPSKGLSQVRGGNVFAEIFLSAPFHCSTLRLQSQYSEMCDMKHPRQLWSFLKKCSSCKDSRHESSALK